MIFCEKHYCYYFEIYLRRDLKKQLLTFMDTCKLWQEKSACGLVANLSFTHILPLE